MRYASFIHRDDDMGYGISFPDFPGCVSVGDSVDEAIRHGCEIAREHGYEIDVLVAHLQGKERPRGPRVADQSVTSETADRGTPTDARTSRAVKRRYSEGGPLWTNMRRRSDLSVEHFRVKVRNGVAGSTFLTAESGFDRADGRVRFCLAE